jgi:hypothetical protein
LNSLESTASKRSTTCSPIAKLNPHLSSGLRHSFLYFVFFAVRPLFARPGRPVILCQGCSLVLVKTDFPKSARSPFINRLRSHHTYHQNPLLRNGPIPQLPEFDSLPQQPSFLLRSPLAGPSLFIYSQQPRVLTVRPFLETHPAAACVRPSPTLPVRPAQCRATLVGLLPPLLP